MVLYTHTHIRMSTQKLQLQLRVLYMYYSIKLTTHVGQSDTGPKMSLMLAVNSLGSSVRISKDEREDSERFK